MFWQLRCYRRVIDICHGSLYKLFTNTSSLAKNVTGSIWNSAQSCQAGSKERNLVGDGPSGRVNDFNTKIIVNDNVISKVRKQRKVGI